jgi:hypothetical protein
MAMPALRSTRAKWTMLSAIKRSTPDTKPSPQGSGGRRPSQREARNNNDFVEFLCGPLRPLLLCGELPWNSCLQFTHSIAAQGSIEQRLGAQVV